MKTALKRLDFLKEINKLELFDSWKRVNNNNSIIMKFKNAISISEDDLGLITNTSGRNSPVNNYLHERKPNSIGGDENLQFVMEIPGENINILSSGLEITFVKKSDNKAYICFLNAIDKENHQLIKNEKPLTFDEILLFLSKISLVN